ncbi:hypothetical protein ACWIBS_10010, partial [Microbacterium sp. NPDC055442]
PGGRAALPPAPSPAHPLTASLQVGAETAGFTRSLGAPLQSRGDEWGCCGTVGVVLLITGAVALLRRVQRRGAAS